MIAATAYTKPTRYLHDAYTFPTQKLHFHGQKPRLQRRISVCVNSLLLVSNIIFQRIFGFLTGEILTPNGVTTKFSRELFDIFVSRSCGRAIRELTHRAATVNFIPKRVGLV